MAPSIVYCSLLFSRRTPQVFDKPTGKSHPILQTRDKSFPHANDDPFQLHAYMNSPKFMLKVRSVAQGKHLKCATAFTALHLGKKWPTKKKGDIAPFCPWKVSTLLCSPPGRGCMFFPESFPRGRTKYLGGIIFFRTTVRGDSSGGRGQEAYLHPCTCISTPATLFLRAAAHPAKKAYYSLVAFTRQHWTWRRFSRKRRICMYHDEIHVPGPPIWKSKTCVSPGRLIPRLLKREVYFSTAVSKSFVASRSQQKLWFEGALQENHSQSAFASFDLRQFVYPSGIHSTRKGA